MSSPILARQRADGEGYLNQEVAGSIPAIATNRLQKPLQRRFADVWRLLGLDTTESWATESGAFCVEASGSFPSTLPCPRAGRL
jgi:hypothetical protein